MISAAMAALLLLRQLLELRENRRLFARKLAQEARFRALLRNSSDAVLVVEPGGRISYAGDAADRVFGAGFMDRKRRQPGCSKRVKRR